MISMPGMPSVKHTAELWFDEAKCEARRVIMENGIIDMATEQGINPIYVETWCLKSNMFVIKNS